MMFARDGLRALAATRTSARAARRLALALWLLSLALSPGRAMTGEVVDRAAYDTLLAACVSGQGVNYATLARERGALEAFVGTLETVSSETLRQASPEARMAFWLNAANALALLLVVEKYPLTPEGAAALREAWERERRPVAGEPLSLNEIRQAKLLEPFDDPRLYFALTLASRGGPALRPRSYDAETLPRALDEATREFLASPHNLEIDATSGVVRLSPLFQWFGDDFGDKYAPPGPYAEKFGARLGACLNFIALHVPPETQDFLRRGEFRVEFIEYDARLDEAPPRPATPAPQPTAAPAPGGTPKATP